MEKKRIARCPNSDGGNLYEHLDAPIFDPKGKVLKTQNAMITICNVCHSKFWVNYKRVYDLKNIVNEMDVD
jgi:hypothetical protein